MIVITVCFVIFTPRVSALLFSPKREMTFNSFLDKTKQEQSINPQEFWKFREFYSPGYFELMDQGLEDSDTQSALSEMGVEPNNIIYTSVFRSKHTISLDGLTEAESLKEIIDLNSLQNIVFQNENSIIFMNDKDERIIIFILPISEMKKANGFLEYEGKDKELIKNKNWFNITKLRDK